MIYEIRRAYSEICVLLENIPKEYARKIPKEIINVFQTNKLNDYNPNIDPKNPLDKNYLSKKTLVLIAILNYRYWYPNKKIKNDLYNMYLSNNDKYQKEIEEKYSIDHLFERKMNLTTVDSNDSELSIIEYKESTFKRIINKIKSIIGICK